jgi:hypothetical protein
MMLNRGENSVLLHPLTRHCVEDHTGRVMWMGAPFNLDRTVLAFDEPSCDEPQYVEVRSDEGVGAGAKRQQHTTYIQSLFVKKRPLGRRYAPRLRTYHLPM